MKGVVFLGDRKLELREFPDPTPGPRDVILEIKVSPSRSRIRVMTDYGNCAELGGRRRPNHCAMPGPIPDSGWLVSLVNCLTDL
jgi:hypothetical protein